MGYDQYCCPVLEPARRQARNVRFIKEKIGILDKMMLAAKATVQPPKKRYLVIKNGCTS